MAPSASGCRPDWCSARARSAQALEPGDLHAPRRPLVDVGQGRSPPQLQGVLGQVRRAREVSGRERFPCPVQKSLELPVVQLLLGQVEPIAVRRRQDRGAPEHLAQPDDTALEHFRPRRRQLLAPEGIGQGLLGDRLPGLHDQGGQHHPVAGAEAIRPTVHLEGAEHGDTHLPTVDPCPEARQRARYRVDTAPERFRSRGGGQRDRSVPIHHTRRS
jgi:hypothetical protein